MEVCTNDTTTPSTTTTTMTTTSTNNTTIMPRLILMEERSVSLVQDDDEDDEITTNKKKTALSSPTTTTTTKHHDQLTSSSSSSSSSILLLGGNAAGAGAGGPTITTTTTTAELSGGDDMSDDDDDDEEDEEEEEDEMMLWNESFHLEETKNKQQQQHPYGPPKRLRRIGFASILASISGSGGGGGGGDDDDSFGNNNNQSGGGSSSSSSHSRSVSIGGSWSYDGDENDEHHNNNNNNTNHMEAGQKESAKMVLRLRFVVLVTIVLAAVGVSLAVYMLTSRSEQHEFHQQFDGAAEKVLSSFQDIIDNKFSAIGSLSTQCSLYAKNNRQQERLDGTDGEGNGTTTTTTTTTSWPLVTVADFQLRAEAARELSNALHTRLVPIVRDDDSQRDAWEEYSVRMAPIWIQGARDHLTNRGITFDFLLQQQQQQQDGSSSTTDSNDNDNNDQEAQRRQRRRTTTRRQGGHRRRQLLRQRMTREEQDEDIRMIPRKLVDSLSSVGGGGGGGGSSDIVLDNIFEPTTITMRAAVPTNSSSNATSNATSNSTTAGQNNNGTTTKNDNSTTTNASDDGSNGDERQQKQEPGEDEDENDSSSSSSSSSSILVEGVNFTTGIGDRIYAFGYLNSSLAVYPQRPPGPYIPFWEESPSFGLDLTNWDMFNSITYGKYARLVLETGDMTIGGLDTSEPGDVFDPQFLTSFYSYLFTIAANNADKVVRYDGDPMSTMFLPVFEDPGAHRQNRTVVAMLLATFKWASYFENVLSSNFPGVIVILENDCNSTFTYKLEGDKVYFKGEGAQYDTKFRHLARTRRLGDHKNQNGDHDDDDDDDDDNNDDNTISSQFLGIQLNQDICAYQLTVYPSKELEQAYITSLPIIVTFAVALVFFFTGTLFLLFNWYVELRQRIVMHQAVRSTAIVSSLFPAIIRDRLMNEVDADHNNSHGGGGDGGGGDGGGGHNHHPYNGGGGGHGGAMNKKNGIGTFATTNNNMMVSGKYRIKTFLDTDNGGTATTTTTTTTTHTTRSHYNNNRSSSEQGRALLMTGPPIADLFPDCTVLFADIANFTAWSSTRDPSQVFVLLQTVYQAFDELAHRRGVFKVETIGDSYLAVTGLPNPNKKHAVAMARFAHDCLHKFKEVTKKLEVTLGPDTGDLGLRIGFHSGPVIAGVLRGERSRFQLFGDTVNTAARLESTGAVDRIQMSDVTARILTSEGKLHWLIPREDSVIAKGKGVLATYWLQVRPKKKVSLDTTCSSSNTTHLHSNLDSVIPDRRASLQETGRAPSVGHSIGSNQIGSRQDRLVDWMTDVFTKHVAGIIARQDTRKRRKLNPKDLVYRLPEGKTSLDEVAAVIHLPKFDAKAVTRAQNCGTVDISPQVRSQLREVIDRVASMYRDNPFHNFSHACHVTMAVDKFMSRIQTPDIEDPINATITNKTGLASQIHDYTHGITSDPITLLAIVFSALIHDADHRGVSNAQLAKEESAMAELYRNKSIAEQNSLDVSWQVLMEDRYHELRSTLFMDRSELLRFRQVVVQVVLATDIFDKEMNDLRKKRWDMAFHGEVHEQRNDLRATIVIEHIIQASDVAHTMQHWHIYRKWNSKLFAEMFDAFNAGRMEKDPSSFWYQSELGFFDNYIIPLAKKLKECNVFGVSSDECLNYALQNRAEWKDRGADVVSEMLDLVGMNEMILNVKKKGENGGLV